MRLPDVRLRLFSTDFGRTGEKAGIASRPAAGTLAAIAALLFGTTVVAQRALAIDGIPALSVVVREAMVRERAAMR